MKGIFTYLNLLFYLAFGIVAFSTASTPDDIRIRLDSSTSNVTFGDSISIFCSLTVPEGVQVSEPYLKTRSPFFDIEKQWEKTENIDSDVTDVHYGFLLYAFAPDTLHVGPFTVNYVNAEGDTGSVSSNTLTLPVTGIVENPESPPFPNRTPLEISSKGIPLWIIIVLIFLILIAVLITAYFIYRKNKSLKYIPMKPIDEIGEFERIRNMKLNEAGRVKELYFLVSSAMRGFIHRKMEFDAMYETTYEIKNYLSKTPEDTQISGAICEILEESDRVKFAKYSPTPEHTSTLIDRAIEPVKAKLDEIKRKKEEEASAAAEAESKRSKSSMLISSERSGRE
ncbi:MAG TPA: hypothetical protein ENH82_17040 [bacterium]|nr:hypothetical protein [bacterium]